jgi:Arc/MetJ family transcription regulator
MRDCFTMRTTLDIDEDVLQAAKELGAARRKTAGQVISDLARKALEPTTRYKVRNGVRIFSASCLRPASSPTLM